MKYSREDIARSLLRIALGFLFFWAFLDKLLGLGFATAPAKAWMNGASPAAGFLKNSPTGPFADIYHGMAGSAAVDWLFMLGLALIGLALLLGIGVRIATSAGSVLMLLMWLALLPPKNNPVLDEHIIYILALCVLYHNWGPIGFSRMWQKTRLVRRFPWLA